MRRQTRATIEMTATERDSESGAATWYVGMLRDETICRDNYGSLAVDRDIMHREYSVIVFWHAGAWWVTTRTQRGGERERSFALKSYALEYAQRWASRNYWVDETLTPCVADALRPAHAPHAPQSDIDWAFAQWEKD